MLNDYMQIGKYEADFGYQAVSDFISKGRLLDAVYAGSDMIAIGALHALGQFNISVPKEVSVIGYDDIYMSQHTLPALTTVCQPK
jgi:DNA-binding LacI/PurR family transcriptional regulator